MLKRIMALLILVILLSACSVLAENAEPIDQPLPINLIIFLFDPCGGCGVSPSGCGNCEYTDETHGIIKKQLGDRLYDGSIEYRIFNTKFADNIELYNQYAADYSVEESQRGQLPMIFFGESALGVYARGQDAIERAGEILDEYIAANYPAQLSSIPSL